MTVRTFDQNEVISENNWLLLRERRHVAQLSRLLLLLRVLSVLVTEAAVDESVDADVCVDTSRDQLCRVEKDQTFDIVGLASEEREKDPLGICTRPLHRQNSRVDSCCVHDSLLSVYFDALDVSFQVSKGLQESSVGTVPSAQVAVGVT